jgi:protein-disulfide isomerase
VTLLEYGDYECPYCGAAHPVVEAVRARMRSRLRFAYRHFPLTHVHAHAQRAAEAAEAAGAQGRFWEMHNLLFANQDALDDESLLVYSAQLDLDVARVARELAAGIHAPRVREDFMSGARSGVNGTPTFFFNGVRYDGPRDVESMIAAAALLEDVTAAP